MAAGKNHDQHPAKNVNSARLGTGFKGMLVILESLEEALHRLEDSVGERLLCAWIWEAHRILDIAENEVGRLQGGGDVG